MYDYNYNFYVDKDNKDKIMVINDGDQLVIMKKTNSTTWFHFAI